MFFKYHIYNYSGCPGALRIVNLKADNSTYRLAGYNSENCWLATHNVIDSQLATLMLAADNLLTRN